MFHFHFHFEESYAAWIQAFAALAGIYFLIRNLQEVSRTNKLQIRAQRTANKPNLILTPPGINDINFSTEKNRIRFLLEIENKDAFFLEIATYDSHYELFDHDRLVISRVFHYRIKAGEAIEFGYWLKPTKIDEPSPITIDMHITYQDEQGYEYSQELSGRVLSDKVELSGSKFL